ncbi:GNAT family N-acetyltransferase [Pleurocapsales cyanobacterium LEGE 10410]|nr:GNAT family N-acetyltransferase [Pleurocapsales cyanobacterium LEGE 10410]
MKLIKFDDTVQYYQKVESYLLQQEAIHCLILGISKSLCGSKRDLASQPYLTVVENNKSIVATAIQTPPRKLILSQAVAEEAVELIARERASDRQIPGVIAPKIEAEAFVNTWQSLTGRSCKLDVAMCVHQLETVRAINGAAGQLRLAEESDRDLLTNWIQAFEQEALGDNEPESNHQLWFERHLENKSLFVWQDKIAVSMAAYSGATPNGIRINAVYTPPEHRGKRYATSCVAKISQQLLNRYKYCFLFTNLDNPTSNHIYRQIGYLPMSDLNNYSFH